jgi:hypothetical protein
MVKIDNHTLFFGNFVDADLKLADLHDYLIDVDKFINRKKKYRKMKSKQDLLKDVSIEMFAESFTSILFESVLISAWVFMEAEFNGYCNAMQQAMGIDLSYSDLKGSAIERFRNYTLKVLKLDLALKDTVWEDLKAITEIRNSLVHSNGMAKNKKLINSFTRHNRIPRLLFKDNISLDKDSLTVIITLCRLFVERIYRVALTKFPDSMRV